MADPAPGHIGDVEEAVDAAEIDEGPEVGDVLHHSRADLTDLELRLQRLALRRPLLLQNHSPAHDDVTAPLVQLEDLEVVFLTDEFVDVRNPSERDLRPWKERIDSHEVYRDTTLDLALQDAGDGSVLVVGFLDLLPDSQEVGLLLREDNDSLLVLKALEEDLDLVTRLDGIGIPELIQRNQALGLEADVQDHGRVRLPEDSSLDDFTLGDLTECVLVQCHHLVIFVGRVFPSLQHLHGHALGHAVGQRRPAFFLVDDALRGRTARRFSGGFGFQDLGGAIVGFVLGSFLYGFVAHRVHCGGFDHDLSLTGNFGLLGGHRGHLLFRVLKGALVSGDLLVLRAHSVCTVQIGVRPRSHKSNWQESEIALPAIRSVDGRAQGLECSLTTLKR